MLDEISKKYSIAIILVVLVAAIATAGFGIWRLSKKDREAVSRQPTSEEVIKSLSAPASTTKTTQTMTKEEKKIIDSLTAPTSQNKSIQPAIKKDILDSVTVPIQ